MDDATKALPTYEILVSAFDHSNGMSVFWLARADREDVPAIEPGHFQSDYDKMEELIALADAKLVLDPEQLCFAMSAMSEMHDSMHQWRDAIAEMGKHN